MKTLKTVLIPGVLVSILSMICACNGGGGGGGGHGSTTYSISGTVSGDVQAGVTVRLSGASSGSAVTNSSGNYSFAGLANGSYVVTPSLAGYSFTPNSRPVTIHNANVTGVNFTAAALDYVYSISGTVSGDVQAGVTITLTGDNTGSAITDGSGNYSFNGLAAGSYTVTPSLAGYVFSPASTPVTISDANVSDIDFTAASCYLRVQINDSYAVSVIPPSVYCSQVQYDGIDAKRAFSDVDVGASLNAGHDKLSLEIHNTGGNPIKRLWAIALEAVNVQLDASPDSINKLGQPVFVFGPYAPSDAISRDISDQYYSRTGNHYVLTCLKSATGFPILPARTACFTAESGALTRPAQPRILWISGDTGDLMQTSPVWSPGMEWIAYDEVDDSGHQRNLVQHPDGGSLHMVSPPAEWSQEPVFTPSGKSLIYSCVGRFPSSSSDICMTDINGSYETDLVRGDGYYWDGSAYQPYPTGSGFLYNQVYSPRITPDGQHIIFEVYDVNQSPSPASMLSRMYLYDAPFDPVNNELADAPYMMGSVINSDTIATATKYTALAECIPTFSPDQQKMFCFLKQFQRTSSWVQSPSFYGMARMDLPGFLSALSTTPNAYIGDYITQIYDIRSYKNSQGAYYLNFQDYSEDLNTLFFCTQYDWV